MKYLGVDYGEERVGLAVCDAAETMAFALRTLERRSMPTKEQFFGELLKVIAEEAIAGIVIGLPLPLDPPPDPALNPLDAHGQSDSENKLEESLSCRKVRNFAGRLARRVDLPIYLVNEALSSSEAETRLQQAGFKRDKLKARLDAEAAAVILQQFLNLPMEKRIPHEFHTPHPA